MQQEELPFLREHCSGVNGFHPHLQRTPNLQHAPREHLEFLTSFYSPGYLPLSLFVTTLYLLILENGYNCEKYLGAIILHQKNVIFVLRMGADLVGLGSMPSNAL